MANKTIPTTVAGVVGRRVAGGFWGASAATGVVVVVAGTLGTLAHRGFGRVPFSVPAWPWYHSDPFYLFWDPNWPSGWAMLALPVAVAAAAGVVALFWSQARPGVRVAASAGLLLLLALAVAALAGGPAAWRAPFEFTGEYPHGVGQVGDIRSFLRQFPERLASLPSHAAGHPAGAMVLYALQGRVWPGLDGAALGTVALGCLGALALWVLCPMVALYTATSADAVFAVALAGAVVAAPPGAGAPLAGLDRHRRGAAVGRRDAHLRSRAAAGVPAGARRRAAPPRPRMGAGLGGGHRRHDPRVGRAAVAHDRL
jgi:hypothetical protein